MSSIADALAESNLNRSLGLVDVISLGVNGVVGSGIFLLPGIIADLLGPASILCIVFAGFLCFLIALCFAEVGSLFSATGGPYIYAREAFGSFVGFEVGWMTFCVRIVSWAALANGFAIALAHFYPAVSEGWGLRITILSLMTGLSLVNLQSAKAGAMVANILTVAKLIPLLVFGLGGLFFVSGEQFVPFSPSGYGGFGEATLVILYAFVGFEVLAVPAGEMKNPRRAVPIALVSVMAMVAVVYVIVQIVATGTLPDLAGAKNPVADASSVIFGSWGGAFIAGAIVASVLGVNSGSALIAPRSLYAMAESRQLPSLLAALHPKFKTPWVAIVLSGVLSTVIALTGSFKELAVISVVARFSQYIPTCLAVVVLRRREEFKEGGFRLPGGPVIPVIAALLSLGLMTQAGSKKLIAGGIALLAGIPFYLWSQRAKKKEEA